MNIPCSPAPPHWMRAELVHFFRQATSGDYLEALEAAERSIGLNLLNPPRIYCIHTESETESEVPAFIAPEHFGTMIAQALTSRLIQAFPQLTYKEVSDVVYKAMQDISDFSEIGDWISMPDATTFTCTFKPKSK